MSNNRTVTGFFCTVLGLLLACGPPHHPLREAALQGDPAVLNQFAGRWYDSEDVLTATIVPGDPGRLVLRVPSEYQIRNGRAVENEIHFDAITEGKQTVVALRILEDGLLVMVLPGSESGPSYTPRFSRLSRVQLLRERIAGIPDEATGASEDLAEWIARFLWE